jgi:peptidoglycan/LPS O-acetylase OafA/YrhL
MEQLRTDSPMAAVTRRLDWAGLLPRFGPAGDSRKRSSVRLHELDGLRGWAALSVVAFHIFWETFGALVPDFRNPVTGFFFDGILAVSVFFVLSGEALSSSYFAGGGRTAVFRLAVKRYPRLTIPILAASLIVALLAAAGLASNTAAGEVVHRTDWLGSWLDFPIGLGDVLSFSLADIYLELQPPHNYGPFLWSMRIEMVGSIIVFAVLLLFDRTRFGWVVVGIAAVASWFSVTHRIYSTFLFGVIFAAARHAGFFVRMQRSVLMQVVTWLMIAGLGAIAGTIHWRAPLLTYQPLVAVPLVFAIFCNRVCSNFLANRLSRLLGLLSFPLYLIQFPVFVSVTSAAILYADRHGGLTLPAIWAIALLSLVSCLLAAAAFYPVEVFTKWACDRVARIVPRREAGPP